MTMNFCPQGDKCLLLETEFNRDCKICQLCQQGVAEEYAIRVNFEDRPSEVCRFYEMASPDLPPEITQISIYRLAKENYYSKKVISYKPDGTGARKQINDQLAYYFTHG